MDMIDKNRLNMVNSYTLITVFMVTRFKKCIINMFVRVKNRITGES